MNSFQQQADSLLKRLHSPGGEAPIYHCLLHIRGERHGIDYQAYVGSPPQPSSMNVSELPFRIASISKLFTATLVLQLFEEGHFELETPFLALLRPETRELCKGLAWVDESDQTESITIQNLLEHRSGLADYWADDPDFLANVLAKPQTIYRWDSLLESFRSRGIHKKLGLMPGTQFHYSDTNFLLLAVLVQQIVGKHFHQALEERIFTPLNMESSYLEFFQPAKGDAILFPNYGSHSLEGVNTSFDWGGGGCVASSHDLYVFMKGLFQGRLFKKEGSMERLLQVDGIQSEHHPPKIQNEYGRGMERISYQGLELYGHRGAYGSIAFYDPAKELFICFDLGQAQASSKAEWLMRKLLDLILQI